MSLTFVEGTVIGYLLIFTYCTIYNVGTIPYWVTKNIVYYDAYHHKINAI